MKFHTMSQFSEEAERLKETLLRTLGYPEDVEVVSLKLRMSVDEGIFYEIKAYNSNQEIVDIDTLPQKA